MLIAAETEVTAVVPPALEPPSAPHSDESALLALAPELEAAATPYLTFDRDAEVTSADPDFSDAIDTARALYRAVEGVAERIFAHEPRTLAGLLLTAHAAALTCSDTWDEHPDNGGKDGRLLRLVCNGLFRLVGVDWRGRPVPGALPTPAPTPAPTLIPTLSPDAALIPLADAAIAEEHRVSVLSATSSFDLPPGSFARSMQLLELVSSFEAHTPAGLAAKARVLLEHIPEVDELEGDWRCEALALSIARDAVRLGTAG